MNDVTGVSAFDVDSESVPAISKGLNGDLVTRRSRVRPSLRYQGRKSAAGSPNRAVPVSSSDAAMESSSLPRMIFPEITPSEVRDNRMLPLLS